MQRNRLTVALGCITGLLAGLLALSVPGADAAPATSSKTAEASEIDADLLLTAMAPRSVGPAGMSGRIAAVDAVEADPDVIWVGAATGGVWKSVDGALTWTPVFDDQPVASIGALAIDQSNPNIVWVGTGEANLRNSISIGDGIYRTLDGGKTWSHLGLEKTERIHRIVLHPSNPDVAWVAAVGGAWSDNPERGVYKTEDGGKTWSRVLHVNEMSGASDLVIDPANPNHLIASIWQFRRWPWSFKSGGPGSGLYSTWDGGRTWKKATPEDGLPAGEIGRIGLAFSRSNPEIVYAMVEASPSALLRSADGGKSWATVNSRWDVNPRPFYFCDIRVDPRWPNRVYSLDYDVRVSDDGGKSFTQAINGRVIHGDFHALWINPNNPEHLISAGDGGLGISYDRGKTNRAVGNLPVGQFYHVAVDNDVPYNVYGGMQDNSSWRGPSSSWSAGGVRNHNWYGVGFGDGFETLPDQTDSMTGYSQWQGGNLLRWDLRTSEIRAVKPAPPEGVKLRLNWNAGLATDPHTPGTVYLGSQFLHKSTDRGETWTAISPDLTTNNPERQKQDESGGLTLDATGAESYTTIIAVAPSPIQKDVIWVGTDDGRLHVTRDGGKTWDSVEKNVKGVPANTWIPEVRPSKHDPASAFVAFDNHRRGDMAPYAYRTDDWGKTWTSLIPGGADRGRVRGYALNVEQDPVNPDLLFLGTEFGLWFSQDGGKRWTKWSQGLPTASYMDMVIHPRDHDLVLGTHGRSIYIVDDIRPLRELTPAVTTGAGAKPIHLVTPGDAVQHQLSQDAGSLALGSTEFRGADRPYGAILNVWLSDRTLPHPVDVKERERKEKERSDAQARPKAEPEPEPEPTKPEKEPATPREILVRIANADGKVIRNFTAPARQGLNRIVWDLSRDASRQFPAPPEAGDRNAHPGGPEVTPGTYQVTVKLGEAEASGTVKVLPDPRKPRQKTTPQDWAMREQFVQKTVDLLDPLALAVERLRSTRSDVEAVTALLETRTAETKAREREAARAQGQPDPEPKPTPGKDEKPDALAEAAKAVLKGLDGLEKRLWLRYDEPGIPPEIDAASLVFTAQSYALSSYDAPNATHLEYLRQAETAVGKILADFNQFFGKEVADFRRQVDESGLRLLPPVEPIPVPGTSR